MRKSDACRAIRVQQIRAFRPRLPRRFYEVNWDGTGERTLVPDIPGFGHPSWSAGGRFILTDAYPGEPVVRDGHVPIRLIDVEKGRERTVCWTGRLGLSRAFSRGSGAVPV